MQQKKLPYYQRLYGHFTTITTHKLLVGHFCFKLGLYKQGILHDFSKYSFVEFHSGVKYFQGDRSPIDAEKKEIGYSLGWLHHKGHNKHHWEYWMDKVHDKIIFYPCPKCYVKEMVCDRIAACKVYQKDKYQDSSALTYYQNSLDKYLMNEETAKLLYKYLTWISEYGLKDGLKKIKAD